MPEPRLMVIGLDAVSMSLLDTFKKYCPTIRKLMSLGASGSALPSFPVYTPTNWAVLATGAESSVTGAEGWYRNVKGKRLSTFDRRAIACDTVFDAASRDGYQTLAISYPGAFPSKADSNMVLAPLDLGLVSNCLVPGKVLRLKWTKSKRAKLDLLSSDLLKKGVSLTAQVGATEDGVSKKTSKQAARIKKLEAYVFQAGKGKWKLGFDTKSENASVELEHEKWSQPLPVKLLVSGRAGNGYLRVMVFDRGKRVAISEVYDIGQLGKPADLCAEVMGKLGPPTEHSPFTSEMGNCFSIPRYDGQIEHMLRVDMDLQAKWIVDAARLAMKSHPYDIFYLHHHYPDSVMHKYLSAAEGAPDYSPKQQKLARDMIAMALEVCDGMVAGLLEIAGPETVVLVVSDHGDVPNRYAASIVNRLVETGLMKRKKDGSIDRKRSKVSISPRNSLWIKIHAKRGSAAYEKTQGMVIDALLDWKTSKKERVIALALRKKDAHVLGYHGPDCGDVVFHYNSGFFWGACPRKKSVVPQTAGANHGPQMPVTYSKISDNMAFFVLQGPGVKKNLKWNMNTLGPIRLTDLVPTACELAAIPTPINATGAIRRDLMVTY